MHSGGYMGKMLYVDLTTGNIREEDLDQNIARRYIGVFGISARLAYDLIKPGIDPLSPENFIIIGAGPLVGTSCPSASKCDAWTKYPLTNTIGPGSGGVGFGSGLKHAGYDELIITGRADRPVYLRVSDEGVEICDAGDLWGKDNFEATDEIWKRYGTDYSVVSIGQAGENLAKISLAIVDKSGTLGRHGLGAVIGSKNLKLIVVGGKSKIRISDRARFIELTDQIMTDVMNWPILDEVVNVGLAEYDFEAVFRGQVKGYYNEAPDDPVAARERFGPEVYLQRVLKARLGCHSCPIACRDVDQVRQGEYKGLITFQPHPAHCEGIRLDLQNFEEATNFTHVSQIYGIDRMSFMAGAQFLIDLHKRGIITKDDLEGLEIGNEKSLTKLLEKVAFRQGVGNALADGIQGVVNRFGKECEKYAHCIKGAEPWRDARTDSLHSAMLGAVVSPHVFGASKSGGLRPGGAVVGGEAPEVFRKYGEWIAIPTKALDRILDTPFKVNVARFLRHSEDVFTTYENLGLCIHIQPFFGMERLAGLYSAATGIEMDAYELKRSAERAWNLLKALNVREGFSRKDDKFPPKWLEPMKRGDEEVRMKDFLGIKVLTAEDLEKMLDDYYDERGWDIETGIPTREKLEELGLEDTADDLAERGILPARRPKE
jgi:aldehyde:ferredoxin oxidoreductase